MLFMILVKASLNSEGRQRPHPKLNEAMTNYNHQLIDAGVRVMAKGLHPTSNAIRLHYLKEDEAPVQTKGPFLEAKDQVAGFFLIEVKSKEEAIQWALKCPDPQGDGEGCIELRQVFE